MFSQKKEGEIKHNQEEQKKKPTYWERVIHGKGTVAERRTAEELWNDPAVKKSYSKS